MLIWFAPQSSILFHIFIQMLLEPAGFPFTIFIETILLCFEEHDFIVFTFVPVHFFKLRMTTIVDLFTHVQSVKINLKI